jgi:hypothetical protein
MVKRDEQNNFEGVSLRCFRAFSSDIATLRGGVNKKKLRRASPCWPTCGQLGQYCVGETVKGKRETGENYCDWKTCNKEIVAEITVLRRVEPTSRPTR